MVAGFLLLSIWLDLLTLLLVMFNLEHYHRVARMARLCIAYLICLIRFRSRFQEEYDACNTCLLWTSKCVKIKAYSDWSFCFTSVM